MYALSLAAGIIIKQTIFFIKEFTTESKYWKLYLKIRANLRDVFILF